MTSNYDDEKIVACTIDRGNACRHVDCLDNDYAICGSLNVIRICLLPTGHGGTFHKNGKTEWSTCRRHPMCDCETCKPPPHKCPEPELIVVNEELVRNLQKFIDDLKPYIGKDRGNVYDALRLILKKMEEGFRIP